MTVSRDFNSPRVFGAKRVAKGVRYGIIELSPIKAPSLRRRGEVLPQNRVKGKDGF
jgi:hypothetical protein